MPQYDWVTMTKQQKNLLVAERVMELTSRDFGFMWPGMCNYTTDISAAWKVVEKMQQDGWNMELLNAYVVPDIGRQHHCDFKDGHGWGKAYAPTTPEAICLAALRAKGVDV